METAIMCPVGSSVTFVLALDVDDSPGPLHYPYQCPHCDGMVTDAGTNPGLLTTDDLVEFPDFFCGEHGALLTEAGARSRAVASSEAAGAACPASAPISAPKRCSRRPRLVWRPILAPALILA